jgi:hypothetical protein
VLLNTDGGLSPILQWGAEAQYSTELRCAWMSTLCLSDVSSFSYNPKPEGLSVVIGRTLFHSVSFDSVCVCGYIHHRHDAVNTKQTKR